jgi:hypothetical protein
MRLLSLVLSFSLTATAVNAQATLAPQTQKQAETEVLAVVNRLWEAMRTNDSVMARTVFDTGAQMFSISPTGTVSRSTPNGFIRSLGRSTTPWIERMINPEVRVDQNLASVWTWYDFTRAGVTLHCGYDSIELARTASGWKIIYLADTRTTITPEKPDVCKPPAPR